MRVTTLIENRPNNADPRLVAEWGLSLHVTFKNHRILFDTGSSGSFAGNAEHLSVDIASVDTAVLSHHHYDHGGGLRRFFELNSAAKVFLGKKPAGECVAKLLFRKRYVGLDRSLASDFPGRFETVTEPVQIFPDVFVFPSITGNYPRPRGNRTLYVRKDGALMHDDFSHEVIMAIKEHDQLVIFTGCSHNGILNMVDTVAREFKGIPVKAVFGGFHLVALPPFNFIAGSRREVEDLARMMLSYPIYMTYTGHCTGTKAFDVLKGVMGDRIMDMRTGTGFEV